MLAPVLARLQSCPGVERAYVDLTGQYFLVISDGTSAIAGVLPVLGAGSCAVASPANIFQIETFRTGEIWLDCGNIENLSKLEARFLATKWGGVAARAAGISVEMTLRFTGVLQRELNREFAHVHGQGGTSVRDWYKWAFADAFERVMAECRSFVDPAQADKIASSLRDSLK